MKMKATNKIIRWAAFLVASVMLTVGMSACGDKNEIEEPDTPVAPVTPIHPEDYVTIPASGGTVNKDDIAITFPDGTFTADTKVAVTKVQRGKCLGDDEVSTFYQLTLPPTIGKPLTVSIVCDEEGDDINVVAHTRCYRLSEDETTFNDILLESSYSGGVYNSTVPAFYNGTYDADDQLAISIGVAHLEYCGDRDPSEVKATRAQLFNEKFTEGNVSWHFNFSPYFKHAYADKLLLHWDEINETIREAIKQLHDLGLKVTKRDIGMSFKNLGEPDGVFEQSCVKDEWSTVAFNTNILDNFAASRDRFRRSAIHELMHIFQADYDSRWPYNKAGGLNGVVTQGSYQESDELLLLYESGAVWAEQFMGGSFSTEFASTYISDFIQGFDDADLINPDVSRHKRYEYHGYGASVLMQYLTKGMRSHNLNDKSIAELYKIWHDTNYWLSKQGPKNCIKDLTKTHGRDIFQLDYYDDFLISLATGDLIDGISCETLAKSYNGNINATKPTVEVNATCYPFGAQANSFRFSIDDNDSQLESKELLIEQSAEDVCTYLFMLDKEENKWYRVASIFKDMPYAISGFELKEKYGAQGKTTFDFYTLTTTKYRDSSCPSSLKATLRDTEISVSPTELLFSSFGGMKDVIIHHGSYQRYGAMVRPEGHGWCSVATGRGVSIIVQPNTTGQRRTCIVDCYVTNEENPTEAQMVKMPVTVTQEAESDFTIGMAQFYVGVRCNIVEIGSDGRENTKELMGGLKWNDYVTEDGFNHTKDQAGHHFSTTSSYTDEWGHVNERTLSFTIGNNANISEGSRVVVSNLKSTYKLTQENTVETYELTANSIELKVVTYPYMNGLYAEGELRGNAVNQAELKYTNYLRGSLWQKYVETIPDADNSISFILSVTSNEPETPGFRSPVKPTATSSTTR